MKSVIVTIDPIGWFTLAFIALVIFTAGMMFGYYRRAVYDAEQKRKFDFEENNL